MGETRTKGAIGAANPVATGAAVTISVDYAAKVDNEVTSAITDIRPALAQLNSGVL